MNCIRWIMLLAVFLTLTGCSQTPITTPTPTPLVVTREPNLPIGGNVAASGAIVPALETQMSFTLTGRIKDLAVSAGDQVEAGQTLIVLEAPELAAGVADAEAALLAAQAILEYHKYPRKHEAPEDREKAQARVEEAEAAVLTAHAMQAQATLVAPFEATITSLDVSTGEAVEVGQTVVTLADLGHLQVETTDLSERDISRVKVGQSARIYVDALGQEITGQVTQITPKASSIGGDKVYKVIITLSEQPEALRWGMNAAVEIEVEEE